MINIALFKHIGALLPVVYYERYLAYSILRNKLPQAFCAELLNEREDIWEFAINRFINPKSQITYIEFGVWQGNSIKYFAAHNDNQKSLFVGLDSFEGLPEEWGGMSKGAFSTHGKIPVVDDHRIHFVKGWFQDSWGEALNLLQNVTDADFFVHYDADLYSSTLFALTKIDVFKKTYYAIFDEFAGHETRALYNYCQAYGATVEFLARSNDKLGFPCQILCKISPRST